MQIEDLVPFRAQAGSTHPTEMLSCFLCQWRHWIEKCKKKRC